METFCQFAVAAAKEALETSGIDMEKEDPFRVGVSVGSGIGSLQALERNEKRLLEKGPGRVEPLLVPLMISNMAAGNVSIQFGLKGKCINVVTACATGTHSIGEAFRSIQHGEADVMVAGGTEAWNVVHLHQPAYDFIQCGRVSLTSNCSDLRHPAPAHSNRQRWYGSRR